ncbi:MAG TPA: hypothetical protein PKO06_23145, partial [Candidatus Ozemobacteraceae bacterium]|nr:hypothetical protein [Candidatus Ozemobacteraceae bacterium]
LFWDIASPSYNQRTYVLTGFESMGLVFARSDALAEEFGLSETIQAFERGTRGTSYPMMAFSAGEPAKLWLDKRLQRFPHLGPEVRRRFLADPTEEFEVGEWLAVTVSFNRQDYPFRCLVLGDLGPIVKRGQQRRINAARVSLTWVLLGIFLMLGPWRVRWIYDSIKVRLGGAFLLAMLLPILGLGWTGASYLESEKSRLLREVRDRCRERIRKLELRYQAFQSRQEVLWQDRMTALVSHADLKLPEIQAGLASMAAEGLFTHYYISEPDGRVALTNYEIQDDSDRRSMQGISLMLKMIMTGRHAQEGDRRNGPPEGKELLQEEVRENIVQTLGTKSNPQKFLRAGRLYATSLGNLNGFSMSLFFTYEGATRLIWVWATIGNVERAFARDEIQRWKLDTTGDRPLPYRLVFVRPGEYATHDVPATMAIDVNVLVAPRR